MNRSSRPEVFCEKGVLRNFSKFTGNHLCQSLFFNKVAGLRPATLLKNRLWHKCFSVNFAKFLRTPFLTEHLPWLLFSENQVFQASKKPIYNFWMDKYIDFKSVPLLYSHCFLTVMLYFFETGINLIVTKKKLYRMCSIKKLLLEILHYLQENTCVGVSF